MKKQNIMLNGKVVLITGVAGFIGSNLVHKLLCMKESVNIIGIDNMNDYYDVSIKEYSVNWSSIFYCIWTGRTSGYGIFWIYE